MTAAFEQALAHRMSLVAHGMFTVKEAAEYSTLGETFLRGLIRSGELPVVRAGDRVLVPKRALDEWLAERVVL